MLATLIFKFKYLGCTFKGFAQIIVILFLDYTETHIANTVEKPLRLQEYGVGIFSRIASKSALKKALKKKLITVDGKIASTATLIFGTEVITYSYAEDKLRKTRLILDLEVVYEDDHLAVINKPPGILVSGNGFKTIANGLGQNLNFSNARDAIYPLPAHRLDYATSGLLLVGKTRTTLAALNRLFEEQKIRKVYYAITIGKMQASGMIDCPVDDKAARSSYEVLKSITSKRFEFLNLVKLSPSTGRRHQLRKHLYSIGTPILGDAAYFLKDLQLKGKGLYLQAQELKFIHPRSGEELQFGLKLPVKFQKLFPSTLEED